MPPETTPPSLAEVQRAMMALVTGRQAPGIDGWAEDFVAGDVRAPAAERVAVYAHMVRARLTEALESQFPRLARRLGPEAFEALARAYLADEPSRHPSLRFLGARLPGWLAARRPAAPALVGLATLEWARAEVFDLADEPTLTFDAVRARPPERLGELTFRLVAAHRLVFAARGTAARWTSPEADRSPGPGEDPDAGDEALLVWREGTVVFHRPVDDAERRALARAARGTSVGALCDALLADHGEAEAIARAHGWLSTWLADGLLVAAAP